MGRFAVIGLGNFGSTVARVLYELGHEVITLDRSEHRVNAAQKHSSIAMVGSATDMELLNSLNIDTLNAVFVSLGDSVSDSILATLYLLDLEAKRIVVKIISDDHGRVLKKVGAHDIVFPEKDTAVRVAHHVSSPTIMDYLEVSPEYSIQEILPKKKFIGRTLAESGIRRDYGVNVIGIKNRQTANIDLNPPANYVIKETDLMLVFGRHDDLDRLSKV